MFGDLNFKFFEKFTNDFYKYAYHWNDLKDRFQNFYDCLDLISKKSMHGSEGYKIFTSLRTESKVITLYT